MKLKKTNLSVEEHKNLKKYCYSKKIDYLCTPFHLRLQIFYKKVKLNF